MERPVGDLTSSKVLSLRPAVADDAPALAALYAHFVRESPATFETEPPDAAEFARRVQTTGAARGWLVLYEGSELAGYAYATVHRPRAAYRWAVEVSVYVDLRYHRRGIARALYHALFELVRRQGLRVMLAGITLPNEASQGLHRALGFRPFARFEDIGFKFDAWHTTEWWRLECAQAGPPQELVPVADALCSDAWQGVVAAALQLVRPA